MATKKPVAKTPKNVIYLGTTILKEKSIRTKKTIYTVKGFASAPTKLIDAKKLVLSKHITGKVSVLDIAKIKKMVAKIKTKTDLNLIIKKMNAERQKGLKGTLPKGMTKSIAKSIKVTGLRKEDGTLQKGYKYAKGGKIVKAKTNKKVTKTAK